MTVRQSVSAQKKQKEQIGQTRNAQTEDGSMMPAGPSYATPSAATKMDAVTYAPEIPRGHMGASGAEVLTGQSTAPL